MEKLKKKIVETKEMSCHGASKEAEFGVYTVQFSPVT